MSPSPVSHEGWWNLLWIVPLALMVLCVIVGGAVGYMQKRNDRRIEHDQWQAFLDECESGDSVGDDDG